MHVSIRTHRPPRWVLLALALILLAGTAQTVWALSCVSDRNERLVLEIESVQIDGVEQEDLSTYERQTIGLSTYFSPDTLQLSYGEPGAYSDIFITRMGATDE